MKVIVKESQFVRLLNELTLGQDGDGNALIDNKPYKVKKGIIDVNVNKLALNRDGSATLSWSAMFKSGEELIPSNTVNSIVNQLSTTKSNNTNAPIATIKTKLGDVSIVPLKK